MPIGVAIVTYNRLNDLKKTLELFARQSSLPAYLIVVDNASTDGTGEFLKQWASAPGAFPKHIILKEENTGGSGGFHTALEAAQKMDADWIWLSDDDAFPEPDALEVAGAFLSRQPDALTDISAICGTVINNGSIDTLHRRNLYRKGLRIVEQQIPASEYARESFPLNCLSYIGAIINKAKLTDAGLTNKDYFLWYDDTEHSMRLSKCGKVLCVPAVRIHHDIPPERNQLTWKTYYGIRNQADLYRSHFPRICYLFFCGKLLFKAACRTVLGRNPQLNRITWAAIRDCANQKFGLHPLYRPGWKP